MKKIYIFGIVILLSFFYLNNKFFSKDISVKKYLDFKKNFTQIGKIQLDIDNLIIGEISKLLILGNTKKIVLFDLKAEKLIFIDLNKNQFKKISVENVLPGYKIFLGGLFKDKNNGFSFSSPPDYYFRFDNNCKLEDYIRVKDKFLFMKFSFIDNTTFLGHFANPIDNSQSLILYDYKKNKTNKLTDINFSYKDKNAITRTSYMGGGLLIDSEKNIYISDAIENKIYKYNKSGDFIMVFNSNAKDYKQRPNLSSKNTIEQINIVKKNNYSSFLNMYFLNRNTIVALYMINYTPYIELFNIDDVKSVIGKAINIPYHMAYAQNDTIYLIKQAEELDRFGNLPNPTILKYKFNGK